MKRFLLIMTMILWATSAQAANWYVDNVATGSNNGTSWANAWTNITSITGLRAGDTVFFSGGSSGKTYTVNNWTPAGGTSENPITYAVGQDAGHTGMVTFDGTGNWLTGNTNNITMNGAVSGTRKMTVSNAYGWTVYNDTVADHHVRLLYLNFTAPIWARGGYWELGYSSGKSPLSTLDDSYIAHLGDGGTAGSGINSIHHSIIQVNRIKTQGRGQDALKWVGNVDIYNNVFLSVYNAAYTGGQHNDGIQTSASYMRIYNNYFENFMGYPIFIDMFEDNHDLQIYNNVFKADEAGVDWGAYQAIAIGPDGGSTGTLTMSNMIIANNTFVGTGHSHQFGVHINTGKPGVIRSGVYVVNNLFYNMADGVRYVGPGTVTVSNNSDAGTANKGFVSNALYPIGDFHLSSLATAAIDQGINPSYLTSIYTTDRAGVSRMLKPSWDIGAYAFGALGQVPPRPPQDLEVH